VWCGWTLNSYVKRAAQPEPGLAAGHDQLHFSDVAPIVQTSPVVAAQAFYHCLVLASQGFLRVKEQLEPYGEASGAPSLFTTKLITVRGHRADMERGVVMFADPL
jgi:hypothetical protein